MNNHVSPSNQNARPLKFNPGIPNPHDRGAPAAELKSEGDISKLSPFNANDISNITEAFPNLMHLEEKDLKIAISKLRKQNDQLRDQLKDLSLKLTDVLEKSKPKPKTKEDNKNIEFKEDTLVKELENSKQQVKNYKKELQQLKGRLDVVSGEDRVVKLEVLLKQREQMIEDLGIETKNLMKINRDQEKEISSYQKEYGFEQKVSAANEEIASLREKVRDVQNLSKMNEKNFKKQQEYLANLNNQYTLVCDKVGIPTSFTFNKMEELNEKLAQKAKEEANNTTFQTNTNKVNQTTTNAGAGETVKTNGENRDKSPEKKIKITEEMIRELHGHEIILQKQLQSLDKKFSIKIGKTKVDIAELQNNIKDYEDKIRRKDTEISDLEKKVGDMKKITKKSYTNLNDPLKMADKDSSSSGSNKAFITEKSPEKNPLAPIRNQDSATKSKKTTTNTKTSPKNNQTTPLKTEEYDRVKEEPQIREVVGGKTEDGLIEFGDDDVVENPATSKIVKVTVWIGQNFLNGVQVSYRINNSEDVVGNQHLAPDMKGKTKIVESLQIDPDDHISYISGKYGEALVSLKLQTAKGKIKDFGDMKADGEDFEVDIKPGEMPTTLFGAFTKRKDKKGKEEILLANVGFVLVKKQF